MIPFLTIDVGPCPPISLVGCCDDNIGIVRVDHKISHTSVLQVQNQSPGFPAIDCLVKPPLTVHLVIVELSFRCHINDIRILMVDLDTRDEITLFQTDVLPRFSGVYGFPHAVPVSAGAGMQRLSCSGIDDLGIRRRHSQIAHAHVSVFVEDGFKMNPSVLCFPDASGRSRHIIGLALTRRDRKRSDPPGESPGPDMAPAKFIQVLCGYGSIREDQRISCKTKNEK